MARFREIALAFALTIGLPSVASAQVVTLASLETRAIEISRALVAEEAQVRAADARVRGTRRASLPSLQLDLGGTMQPGTRLITLDPTPTDTMNDDEVLVSGAPTLGNPNAFDAFFRYTAGVRFEGILYDFGRTGTRVRGGRAEADAERADVAARRDAIVRDVRTAYLAWYAAHAAVGLAESQLSVAESRVEALSGAVGAGARSAYDRDVAVLEAARVRLLVARARADVEQARIGVEATVGEALPENATPDPTIADLAAPATDLPDPAGARALEKWRDAAQATTRLRRLRHAPLLTTGARVGVSGQGDNLFPSYQLQLGLTVPLWDPRMGDAIEDEAIARAAAFDAAAEELRIQTRTAERRARARFTRANEEVALANEVVTLAERASQGAEERWRIAGGSIDAVLAAREREAAARTELVRSKVDRAGAALSLIPPAADR